MNYICELLKKNGAVTTVQVSHDLNVSVETIRRDFLALEEENRLLRVHGGAVLPSGGVERMPLTDRLEINREEKRILSDAACDFIKNGDIIAVDTGSTAVEFAEILSLRFKELTVITHSLDVFERLQNKSGFKNILVAEFICRTKKRSAVFLRWKHIKYCIAIRRSSLLRRYH